MKYYELPVIIVATKADKIARGKIQKHISIIKKDLEMEAEDQIFPFSSLDKRNLPEIMTALQKFV